MPLPTNEARETAIRSLHERGGHFVLCDGKRPVWPGWQRRRPGLDITIGHGPDIGLIPWSLGTSALDVDLGEIGELVAATGPLATLDSPNGHHCYFEDTEGRGNSDWQAFGCRGQVRSARGFLRLYDGGPERLESALAHTPAGSTAFPADLFSVAAVHAPRSLPVEPPTVHHIRAPADLPPLETLQEGQRNNGLFDHTRFWAYPQDKGKDLSLWADRVARITGQFNQVIPDPLPEAEAHQTAWSVASWTWAGGGPIDHSPAAQRRRGVKSGKVRRKAVKDRDVQIVRDRASGMTIRAIADKHGIGRTAVHHVLRRDTPLLVL